MIGRRIGWLAKRVLHAATVGHPYRRDVIADLNDAHAIAARVHGEDAAGRFYAWQVLRSLGPIVRTSEIDAMAVLRAAVLSVVGYLIVLGIDRAANSLIPAGMAIDHRLIYRLAALSWISASGVLAAWLVARGARRFGLVADAFLLFLAAVIGVRYVAVGSPHETAFRLAKVGALALAIAITSVFILTRTADAATRPRMENE
jgi:hypothetical protein